MAQITLNVTDTAARVLAALEDRDGQTIDQRFAKYVADVVQNEAGLSPALTPERLESRLAELEDAAAAAKAARLAAAEPTTTNEETEE